MNQDSVITVTGLEKRYRNTVAVSGLDFELRRGEVLGLIGPNGAGKTTTIRMLTGFLTPTRGRIEVLGRDRKTDSPAVNRLIGYLPENVPLYPDLKVREYLKFRARLKGVRRRDVRPRMAAVLEALELETAAETLIGDLSKGYRQRVGLAAAQLDNPPILILDEPTIGLDPAQIRGVRALVRAWKARQSILISSHILSELEKTCDRVLMLFAGRRVALGDPAGLAGRDGNRGVVVAEARGDAAALQARLESLDAVEHVEREAAAESSWHRFRIRTLGPAAPLTAIGEVIHAAGGVVRELREEAADLESIYHRMVEREGGRE